MSADSQELPRHMVNAVEGLARFLGITQRFFLTENRKTCWQLKQQGLMGFLDCFFFKKKKSFFISVVLHVTAEADSDSDYHTAGTLYPLYCV